MATARDLRWDGCSNVRDLGGLPTVDGRTTRSGALVRADSLHRLTPEGWRALVDHGMRTVVDLRHPGERDAADALAPPPPQVEVRHRPVEQEADLQFIERWGPQLGTPLYYRAALDRYAELTVEALRAVATAPPGGVVVHCVAGRGRTGLVALLLLGLVGVPAAEIASDHAVSYDVVDAGIDPDAHLLAIGAAGRDASWRTRHEEAITALLEEVDVEAHLRAAGLRTTDLDALRARLLDPGSPAVP